jgi:hypothetical protein
MVTRCSSPSWSLFPRNTASKKEREAGVSRKVPSLNDFADSIEHCPALCE